MYIPEGYGTVFPYMIVADADGFARFLSEVFEASELGRTVAPDGRVANIRIRIGTTSFMVGEAQGMKPVPGSYYIYVDDVDAVFEKAVEAGASVVMKPADMPYMDRQGGVQDPHGNYWWISRRLVEEPYKD